MGDGPDTTEAGSVDPECEDDDDGYINDKDGHSGGCVEGYTEGYCEKNGKKGRAVKKSCPLSCGLCGVTDGPDTTEAATCEDDNAGYKNAGGRGRCNKRQKDCEKDSTQGARMREYCLVTCG